MSRFWIDDGQMDRWTDIIQSVTVFGVRHGCQYFMGVLRTDARKEVGGWGLDCMAMDCSRF